jgi:hypothetical protein
MVRVLSLLAVAVASLSALGAPPDVPAEVKTKPGKLVRIVVKTDAEIGIARNFKDEEAFFGELVSPKGTRVFIFQAPDEATKSAYVISWWTKGETEGVMTTIDTGAPPTPSDDPSVEAVKIPPELMKALQDAYTADGGNAATKLAAACKYASDIAKSAQRGTDLIAAYSAEREKQIGEALPKLRRAGGDYLNTILPRDPSAAFTDADRKKASDGYALLAAAIAKLK